MRVAYLINQYPQPTHSFIRREIAALERLGYSIDRYSLRPSGPLVEAADVAEERRTHSVLSAGLVRLLGRALLTALTRPTRFARALASAISIGWHSERGALRHLVYFVEACTLAFWLRREGAEHLHAHFGTNSTAVALLVHRLGGPSYSFTAHGPEEFEKARSLALPEKVRCAEFVVAVCDYGRSQLCRLTPPADWRKLVVVRCGLDDGFHRAPPAPIPAEPRLVCVARLGEQKGHHLLLEALAQLKRRGVPFQMLFIGDGPLRGEIEKNVRDLDLHDRVRMIGWVDERAVRTFIASSRGLVLASFAEGLPVVLMEAFALGRPVVATAVGGVPELVDHTCGWMVPAGSTDSLIEALSALLATPETTLERMGSSGRARVAMLHDSKREAMKLAALFSQHRAAPASSVERTPEVIRRQEKIGASKAPFTTSSSRASDP